MKFRSVLILTILASTLTLTSCASKKVKPTDTVDTDTAIQDDGKNAGMSLDLNGDSDSNRAGALQTVYFDYDSAALTGSTKSALDSNAEFLKKNIAVKIQVEGHCDERGSVQYNLALGEKRAKSVRDYLTGAGVKSNRISTISLGKEKSISFGHDEESWSKNRRANFLVTDK
jgi:peptidoglycan-associated lipoprotein